MPNLAVQRYTFKVGIAPNEWTYTLEWDMVINQMTLRDVRGPNPLIGGKDTIPELVFRDAIVAADAIRAGTADTTLSGSSGSSGSSGFTVL